jgi:uncharacterized protein (TIGR03067 family)
MRFTVLSLLIASTLVSRGIPRSEPLFVRVQSAGDEEALRGTWQVVDARGRVGGETATVLTGIVAHGSIAFVGNKMTMRSIGSGMDSSSTFAFTLDTLASPRHIDMVGEGSSEGNKWNGIYRISGDSLRIALPIEHFSDRPVRPVDFGGSNTIALILKRGRR